MLWRGFSLNQWWGWGWRVRVPSGRKIIVLAVESLGGLAM